MYNKELKDRIIEISKKHNLSHLGSCLTAVGIINEIYKRKKNDEPFILSCGHAGLALYVVLESLGLGDAEEMLDTCGIHPDRNHPLIDCSTGSLGQGLPIALGMALANRKKKVYCLISDGESMEGTTWECANIIRKYEVKNLEIHMNFNGWGAYDPIDEKHVKNIKTIVPRIYVHYTNFDEFPFLKGQDAHYVTL